MLIVFALCGSCITTASAATWRTGNFGNGYTTVRLSNTKKAGYIRVRTYNCVRIGNHTGKCTGAGQTNAKLRITLRKTNGNWICQFNTTSKTKLKLGNDHSAYRVYIACRQDLGSAQNFINLGNCSHWAIECAGNTYI